MAAGIRTCFLGGLPPDCQERELFLLFHGTTAAPVEDVRILHLPRGKPTAFVRFQTPVKAQTGVEIANGLVFDPIAEPQSTIRAELAREDTRGGGPPGHLSAEARAGGVKQQSQQTYAPAAVSAHAGFSPQPVVRPAFSQVPRDYGQARMPWAGAPVQQFAAAPAPADKATLFLGDLDAQVTEADLLVYTHLEGFQQLRTRGLGQPRATAWVQFSTPAAAALARATLQRTPLSSMGRPPNIEIANKDIGSSPGQGRGALTQMPQPSGGGHTVFLGSIDATVTEADVQDFCRQASGYVQVRTRSVGQPRATAWVSFRTPEQAVAACSVYQRMTMRSMQTPPTVELARSNTLN
eukprot:TRINITY_DN40940_c0_g1_i1.p1 TRINITY_DN40940_c0_g1~~TRINITY_DN40940_c0_g1_i1.p1  ORF type:complete len:380 (+),score=43.28 TRINITY_DN40940_c0_g1_i1:89-1141(+)